MSDNKNSLVYREQLDDNVIEMLSEDIGSNYSLRTENQKTIVAALNEIHGKDVISNAVGSPLLSTDTFTQMGEKINKLTTDFKSKLLTLGVSVISADKLESLVVKLSEIELGVDAEELLQPYIDSLKETLEGEGVELNGTESLGDLVIKVNGVIASMAQGLKDILINKGVQLNGDESFDELLNKVDNKIGDNTVTVTSISPGSDLTLIDKSASEMSTSSSELFRCTYNFIDGSVNLNISAGANGVRDEYGTQYNTTTVKVEHVRENIVINTYNHSHAAQTWNTKTVTNEIEVKKGDVFIVYGHKQWNVYYSNSLGITITCDIEFEI